MVLRKLDDNGSAGFMLWVGTALFFLGFLFVAVGPMIDGLVVAGNTVIVGGLPCSQDRVDVINFFLLVFKAWPLCMILMPIGLYGIIVGIRERNSVVG
jgi:nitrate reductase NapE component